MNFVAQSEAVAEVETPSLAEQLSQAERAFHDARQQEADALQRLSLLTAQHREAGNAWGRCIEVRNACMKQRADILARIAKENQ